MLAGIIAGMLCNGLSPIEAASTGVFVHGLAGDLACEEMGVYSCMARDILNNIPNVMKKAGGKE